MMTKKEMKRKIIIRIEKEDKIILESEEEKKIFTSISELKKYTQEHYKKEKNIIGLNQINKKIKYPNYNYFYKKLKKDKIKEAKKFFYFIDKINEVF